MEKMAKTDVPGAAETRAALVRTVVGDLRDPPDAEVRPVPRAAEAKKVGTVAMEKMANRERQVLAEKMARTAAQLSNI